MVSILTMFFIIKKKQNLDNCSNCYELKHSKSKINNVLNRQGLIELGEQIIGKDKYWKFYNQIKDSINEWKIHKSKLLINDSGQIAFWNIDSTLLISKKSNNIEARIYFSYKIELDSLKKFKRKLKEYKDLIKSGEYERTEYLGQEIITEDFPNSPIDYVVLKLRFEVNKDKIININNKLLDIEKFYVNEKLRSSDEFEIINSINQISNYVFQCQSKYCFIGIN